MEENAQSTAPSNPRGNNSSKIIIAVVIIIILVAVALLYKNRRQILSNQQQSNQTTQTTTNTQPTTAANQPSVMQASPSSAMQATVKEFTVTGSNFSFSPSTITVTKGDTVKITFKNDQGTHNWMLDEFNAATKTIHSGESDTVTFTADKTGTFEYYCSIGNHKAMGMKGTLTVQ